MKKISITAVLVIALIATLAFKETMSSKANSVCQRPDPHGPPPQQGAQVLYYLGSSLQYDGRTDANGWCNITLQAGTYNIYVYYPPQPNDGCSGSLLNFYHDSNDNETIVLGPEYR